MARCLLKHDVSRHLAALQPAMMARSQCHQSLHLQAMICCIIGSSLVSGSLAAQPHTRRALIDNGIAFIGGFGSDDSDSTPAPIVRPAVSPASSRQQTAAVAPTPAASRVQTPAVAPSPAMLSMPAWAKQFPPSVYGTVDSAAFSISNSSAALAPSSGVPTAALPPIQLPSRAVPPEALQRASPTPAANVSFAIG